MKIALIGYGKMGKTIEQIAIQRGHQIVSIIDINNAEDIYIQKRSRAPTRRLSLLPRLPLSITI